METAKPSGAIAAATGLLIILVFLNATLGMQSLGRQAFDFMPQPGDIRSLSEHYSFAQTYHLFLCCGSLGRLESSACSAAVRLMSNSCSVRSVMMRQLRSRHRYAELRATSTLSRLIGRCEYLPHRHTKRASCATLDGTSSCTQSLKLTSCGRLKAAGTFLYCFRPA